MNLNNIKIFVAVANKGSFSLASKELKLPVSSVSRKVSELENSLDLRLFERSTRKLRLTEVGSQFHESALRGLHEIERGILTIQEKQQLLRGTLRISLPTQYEPWWGLLEAFSEKYPGIKLVIVATPNKLDLIDENIDVVLRVGKINSLSLVARKIMSYHHRIVASKSFSVDGKLPDSPGDLANFPCLAWGKPNGSVVWTFADEKIPIEPLVLSNEFLFLKQLVKSGKGIAELPPFFCDKEIQEGEFIELFPLAQPPKQDVYLLYPSRQQISRLVRTYIDFCIEYFSR